MSNTPPRPPQTCFALLSGWEDYFTHGTPILTYHMFGRPPRSARLKGMYMPTSLFERQLREFREANWVCPSLDHVPTAVPDGQRRCFLTIDDGCVNVLDHALPLLQQFQATATLYLVAGLLGRRTEWNAGTGDVLEPLMDVAQIREWLAAGQLIGAHSMTHRHLDQLTEAEAREEIFASKKSLEDIFGIEIRHFCYPFGSHNERVAEIVREAGYVTASTTNAGLNTPATDPFRLLRITARYPSRQWRNVPLLFRLWWQRWVG